MEVKPGYQKTDVGVIPAEWDAGSLNTFWAVIDCKHVTAEFVDNGIPVASIGEVQSRFVDLKNAKLTTDQYYFQLIEGGRKPQPGNLILSRNATVGEIAQVTDRHPPFAMGQDVCLLRKRSYEYSTDYLQAVFQSPIIASQLDNLMVGSTFKRVNIEQIRNFAVPFPKPPEQRAIATALSDADARLTSLDQLIAKKRDMKHAAMQELLTHKQRLPGFQGDWGEKRLGEVAEIVSGGTPKTNIPEYWGGKIAWCTPTDITGTPGKYLEKTEWTISESGLKNSSASLLPVGSLLLCSRATIGEIKIAGLPVCTNQGFKSLICNKDTSSEFLYYKLLMMKSKLVEKASGSTFLEISKKDVVALPVEFPPFSEQRAIATVLSDMDAELAALEHQRDKTKAIKQGMMQELLTGRIRLT